MSILQIGKVQFHFWAILLYLSSSARRSKWMSYQINMYHIDYNFKLFYLQLLWVTLLTIRSILFSLKYAIIKTKKCQMFLHCSYLCNYCLYNFLPIFCYVRLWSYCKIFMEPFFLIINVIIFLTKVECLRSKINLIRFKLKLLWL